MGSTITYFQNYKAVDKPIYLSVDQALDRIRKGQIKNIVEKLRKETDQKKRKEIKIQELPCICFSGQFSYRDTKSVMNHSGFAMIDFDHIDPNEYKHKLQPYPWIYAMFVSPSGDGLKVLTRIPADIEKHKGHYKAMLQELNWLKGLDTGTHDIVRICFESYDPDMYVNPNAEEFTKYMEEAKPLSVQPRSVLITDHLKLNIAVQKVLNAGEGEKHTELLRASRLAGGFIAGGLVDEIHAILALEEAIQSKDILDFSGAQKTIRDGIAYGKQAPIVNSEVNLNDDDFSFVSTLEDEQTYIQQVRTNTLPQGLTTGYSSLDVYYRFKQGNFVIVNGHDNVGKSSFLWYLAVIANVLHGWKWIIFCAENTEGQVRKSLMQFKASKAIHEMNPVEYDSLLRWAYENFTIIKSQELVSAKVLLTMAQKVNNRSHHHALLIDPYNALDLDIENTKLSSHEYHYRVTAEMRSFCKRNHTSIYLNCHAVTEALRRTHKDGPYMGYLMAPNKADTEGGGKFSNRADDFITIHRHTQHPTDYNLTEVHIRKIKETETGGRPTLKDDPIKFKMERGIHGFFDPETGFNPLSDETAKAARAANTVKRIAFKEEQPEDEDCPF